MPGGPAASQILFEDAASDHLGQVLHALLSLPLKLLLVRPLLRFEITACLIKPRTQLIALLHHGLEPLLKLHADPVELILEPLGTVGEEGLAHLELHLLCLVHGFLPVLTPECICGGSLRRTQLVGDPLHPLLLDDLPLPRRIPGCPPSANVLVHDASHDLPPQQLDALLSRLGLLLCE